MVRFCWNLKLNIFICLPIIFEIKIYKWLFPCPSPSQKVKFSIYIAISLDFETTISCMNAHTINNWDWNPLKSQFFIYGVTLLKCDTHFHMFAKNKLLKKFRIGSPLPAIPLQKSNSYLWAVFSEIWKMNIFICFTNNNQDWNLEIEVPYFFSLPDLRKRQILHFWCDLWK